MKLFLKCLFLIALAGGLGFVANTRGPYQIPWTEDHSIEAKAAKIGLKPVTIDQVDEYSQTGLAWIFDARKEADFDKEHIPGAMKLPVSTFAQHWPDVEPFMDSPATSYVVYCSGKDCDESLELGRQIISLGYTNAYIFVGGFNEWKEAGKDVE